MMQDHSIDYAVMRYCKKQEFGYNLAMSKVAGILLILLGTLTILVGIKEIINSPSQLTPYAAWSSIVLGAFIAIAGIAHFRAPHKAFLISIPLLVTFVVHVYCLALFYNVPNLTLFVGGHILAAILILVLSYAGYRTTAQAVV